MTGKFSGKEVRGPMGQVAYRSDDKMYLIDLVDFTGHYEDVISAIYQLADADTPITEDALSLNFKSRGKTFSKLTVTVVPNDAKRKD